MATNKNQHFVPRCYLRPFSVAEEGAAIHLYNIDRHRFILNAPLKNQCSGDYFYGTDPLLEKAIQTMEGGYASTLRDISAPNFRLSSDHAQTLRLFWLMQYMRTEAAAQRAAASAATMADTIGDHSSNLRLEIKEAVQLGLRTFVAQMHSIDDVKICLFRNCTGIPFVTSDDPAVLTNRWHLMDQRRSNMSFGIGGAGDLFVLPLTPRILCLGYDGDVYSIENKHGLAHVRREADIDAFNQIQFLNCRANIYVRESSDQQYVDSSFRNISGHRLKERHVVHYAKLESQSGGYKRFKVVKGGNRDQDEEAMLHTQVRYPVPQRWPTQIRWRVLGCAYSNGTGTGYIRKAHTSFDAGSSYRKIRTP